MRLICFFADEKEGLRFETYKVPTSKSLKHVFEFLEFEQPRIFNVFNKTKYAIVLQKDLESEPILWEGQGDFEDMDFEFMYILEQIEGQALFSSIAAAISIAITTAVTAIAGTTILTATAISIIATVSSVLAAAVMMGISYAIGQIMQALSPSADRNQQETQNKKSLIMNDSPNINSQGSPIPWVLGEYLSGGVIVGRKLGTYEYVIGDDAEDPSLPDGIKKRTKANLSSAVEGTWYKLVSA